MRDDVPNLGKGIALSCTLVLTTLQKRISQTKNQEREVATSSQQASAHQRGKTLSHLASSIQLPGALVMTKPNKKSTLGTVHEAGILKQL